MLVIVEGRGSPRNFEKPWLRPREAALLSHVGLHDPRHSHALIAATSGLYLLLIGALLVLEPALDHGKICPFCGRSDPRCCGDGGPAHRRGNVRRQECGHGRHAMAEVAACTIFGAARKL